MMIGRYALLIILVVSIVLSVGGFGMRLSCFKNETEESVTVTCVTFWFLVSGLFLVQRRYI